MNATLGNIESLDTGNDVRDAFALELAEFSRYLGDAHSDYSRVKIMMAYMASIYFYEGISAIASILSGFEIATDDANHSEWDTLFNSSHSFLPETYINVMIHGESVAERIRGYRPLSQRKNGKLSLSLSDNAPVYLHVLDGNVWRHKMNNPAGIRGFSSIRVKQGMKSGVSTYSNDVKRGDIVYITDAWAFGCAPIPTLKTAFRTLNLSSDEVENAFISYLTAEIGKYLFLDIANGRLNPLRYSDAVQYARHLNAGNALPHIEIDSHLEIVLNSMSAVLGADRELICIPEGGSEERKHQITERCVHDTAYPVAMNYLRQAWYEMKIEHGINLSFNS